MNKSKAFNNFSTNRLIDIDSNYKDVYDTIISNVDYFTSFNDTSIKRIKLLDLMIEFYEVREDYERCIKLISIKKEIYKNAKN